MVGIRGNKDNPLLRAGRLCADGLRDEQGFTTLGMLCALLLALSLLFTTAQVQRIQSVSASVQDVADAAALAAQNEVAEFMTLVRVCDAVILSLSLTGLVSTGLGVAALCTPATASVSEPLLSAGKNLLKARDTFSQKAVESLEHLQALLPFLSAANAASLAQANSESSDGAGYLALALPLPSEGEAIAHSSFDEASEFVEEAQESAPEIEEAARQAEELAQEASEIKQRAFERDCGDAPGYCMYERADSLANLDALDNPLYRSVDSWSFSVALERARAYYAARIQQEAPENDSIEEQVRSALRKRFYLYAQEQLQDAYVKEEDGSFEAYFPRFPRNTAQMRETSLYTEAVYPLTSDEEGWHLHAWEGCPQASGASGLASLEEMESGNYSTCTTCNFTASSLGSVASASTSISNGFEYHYDAVAQAAAEYQAAVEEMQPQTQAVKDQAGSLLERCVELLKQAGGMRLNASPPGALGSIVFVVNLDQVSASSGFENSFVSSEDSLGTRVALSAASLLADPADDQGDLISSLLDGFNQEGSGISGLVLDCWSGLLRSYSEGQKALSSAVESGLNSLSFSGASGLGSWVVGFFEDAIEAVGLEPANLDALKPILVNSGDLALAEGSDTWAKLISLKRELIQNPSSSSNDIFSIIDVGESILSGSLEGLSQGIEIASIELFDGGPSFTLRLALPQTLSSGLEDLISGATDSLRDLAYTFTGVRVWQ